LNSRAGGSDGAEEGASRLRRLARATARRVRVRRAFEAATRMLPWSVLASALVLALLRLLRLHLPGPPEPRPVALIAASLVILPVLGAALAAALRARLTETDGALLADRALDSKERLVTALWLAREPGGAAHVQRALDVIGKRSAADLVPWRPTSWRVVSTMPLLLLATFTPAWPLKEAPAPAAPDTRIVAAAKAVEEKLREQEERLEEAGASEASRDVLAEMRRTLERAQLEPMTSEEAMTELQRLDQVARREQEKLQAAERSSLERALSSIELATLQRDAARSADDSRAMKLDEQLRELAKAFDQGVKFEQRDLTRMARRLEEAAEALREAGHDSLATQLEQLAEAIEKGDLEKAAELAETLAASAELRQAVADASENEALTEARQLVQQAMASLGSAKTDAQIAEMIAKASGQSPGEDGEGEDGEGKGGGKGGKGDVKRDWGVGTTDEESAGAATGEGHQQDRQSSETSDWREAYSQLHDSTRLDSARGRVSQVHGQATAGSFDVVETRTIASGPETAAAPQVSIPPSYRKAREEALAREEIPPSYRDAVREYFTSIDSKALPDAPPTKP